MFEIIGKVLIQILMILTFGVTILNILTFLAGIFGNVIEFPYMINKKCDPTHAYIFYPSFLIQVCYWAIKFNLFDFSQIFN